MRWAVFINAVACKKDHWIQGHKTVIALQVTRNTCTRVPCQHIAKCECELAEHDIICNAAHNKHSYMRTSRTRAYAFNAVLPSFSLFPSRFYVYSLAVLDTIDCCHFVFGTLHTQLKLRLGRICRICRAEMLTLELVQLVKFIATIFINHFPSIEFLCSESCVKFSFSFSPNLPDLNQAQLLLGTHLYGMCKWMCEASPISVLNIYYNLVCFSF